MRCERCGSELVEVDNPMRREFRHRRGIVCAPAPKMSVPAPQPLASRPETTGTGSGRGTGEREAHGTAQAFEEGRRIAVSMMDRAEAKWRHEHGQPHLREHCETCAEEYWSNRLRPGHYLDAAADLRKAADAWETDLLPFAPNIAFVNGINWAADRLESYARDLSDPGEGR